MSQLRKRKKCILIVKINNWLTILQTWQSLLPVSAKRRVFPQSPKGFFFNLPRVSNHEVFLLADWLYPPADWLYPSADWLNALGHVDIVLANKASPLKKWSWSAADEAGPLTDEASLLTDEACLLTDEASSLAIEASPLAIKASPHTAC